MALTKTITKKSVKYGQEKLHIITFNLVLTDNMVEVLNQDFSCEYRAGENPADKVAEITGKMQICIERYKNEKAIFNNTQLDNAVIAINSGLIL